MWRGVLESPLYPRKRTSEARNLDSDFRKPQDRSCGYSAVSTSFLCQFIRTTWKGVGQLYFSSNLWKAASPGYLNVWRFMEDALRKGLRSIPTAPQRPEVHTGFLGFPKGNLVDDQDRHRSNRLEAIFAQRVSSPSRCS